MIYDFSHMLIYLLWFCHGLQKGEIVRTYVIHLLGTYVTILRNWLIFWQNTLYLYLDKSRMCLILQETLFQIQVLKPCKSVQDSSWKVHVIKAWQLVIYRALKSCSSPWLDNSSTNRHLSRFMKFSFLGLFFIQSMIVCLGFLFSQP